MVDETLPFSSRTHIGVLEQGTEEILTIENLRSRFGVHALIRLHAADFAMLTEINRVFVHFNLEATLNETGRRYAILPIIKPGRRLDDGRELLPVVDPTRFRLGTSREVLQRVPVASVSAEQFAHSLPTIRTAEELRAALVTRYAHMFPNLTDDEIVARGCAVTQLLLDD